MPAANFDVEIDWHSLMKLDDEEELAKNNDENWDELCDSFSDKGDDEEEDLTSLNQQDKDMSASKCVMFASQVTLDGLRVSIQSLVELVDFLLPKYPYVLTEKFSQDVLEVYLFPFSNGYFHPSKYISILEVFWKYSRSLWTKRKA